MIYIATHKKFDVPNEKDYIPLHVGAFGKDNLGYLYDNTGDNISYKNKNYCELTGVYWIYKNSKDDIKGLVHYRRYFSNKYKMKLLSQNDYRNILKKYDVILPFEYKLDCTVLENYEECGFKKDLEITREIIKEKYPDYLDTFNALLDDNKIRLFNMMVAKDYIFNEYSEWLFDILFELEKRIDISDYNDYQQRIYGFISERLLNVYFRKNNLKIYECGVYPTEVNWKFSKRVCCGLKRKVFDIYQLYIK